MDSDPTLRLGTCAFTAAGWRRAFYPPGLKSSEYLSYYSRHFSTVEIDSTFYGVPNRENVARWYRQTPRDFLFSLKAPRVITHERCMVDCDADLNEFLTAVEPLKEKLGPILFQFPYFSQRRFNEGDEFVDLLEPFVERLPDGYRFAIEIRNRSWFTPRLLDILRRRSVVLALIDHPFMPEPREWLGRRDLITGDFLYIRWLGDRHGIEALTRTWDKVVIDRRPELKQWVEVIREFVKMGAGVHGYANNHYAGNGPSTVRLFMELWDGKPYEGTAQEQYTLGF
jgi:uncharacterized protein YecE (DUF72 family)